MAGYSAVTPHILPTIVYQRANLGGMKQNVVREIQTPHSTNDTKRRILEECNAIEVREIKTPQLFY